MAESTTISNTENLMKYMGLDQKGYSMAEYIWIDGQNGVRSKTKVRVLLVAPTYSRNAGFQLFSVRPKLQKRSYRQTGDTVRLGKQLNFASERVPNSRKYLIPLLTCSSQQTLDKPCKDVSELSEWNFDGSSCGQAPSGDSDVYLRPVAIYPDPFRGGDNILVMCECWDHDGTPNKFNYRHEAARLMNANSKQEPWFGLEQEYTLLGLDERPYGWPKGGFPAPQGPYYCAVGTGRVYCRDIVEAHYKACLFAGIKISGINAEVMPGQWEFQVGPCEGIELGDHLWMARFMLHRVAEEFGVIITFAPKPVAGDWNGAGLHTNVSTADMRKDGGLKTIESMMGKLEKRHVEHMEVYGEGNAERMTGEHETASMEKFSWAIANRGSSVRIPRQCAAAGKGYFEDRRPASNADPYRITGMMMETLFGGLPDEKMSK